jgi:hypothetical protein
VGQVVEGILVAEGQPSEQLFEVFGDRQ